MRRDDGVKKTQRININIPCSIDNCVGCNDNDNPKDHFIDLQNKCYSAAQCAVERCVGTTVNLRRPLCNLGKALAGSFDQLRVQAQSVWVALCAKVLGS